MQPSPVVPPHWLASEPPCAYCEQLRVMPFVSDTAKPMTNVVIDDLPETDWPLLKSALAVACGVGKGHTPFGEPVFEHDGWRSRFGAPSVRRIMNCLRQPPCTNGSVSCGPVGSVQK